MSAVIATHIWAPTADEPEAVPALTVDFGGALGDRHYGETMHSDTRQRAWYPKGTVIRNHRQLSLIDIDELNRIADLMGIPVIEPGVIADNICTSGIPDLTSLPPMTRLVFSQGAVVITGGENLPCVIAGRMVARQYGTNPEAFPKAAMGRRGITGWVERPGIIAPGDTVTMHPPGN